MTSAFTTGKLYLEEPGNGDYVDTWDGPLNNNFTAIAAGTAGVTTINLASTGSVTLTNGGSYPYNNLAINLTGSIGTGVTVSIPNTVGGFWIVYNNTSQTVTIQAVTPSVTAPITAGYKTIVWADGTGNVRSMDSVGFLPLSGGTMTGILNINSSNLVGYLRWYNGSSINASWGANTSYPFYVQNSAGTPVVYCDTSGNLGAYGNITAYSDARFKKDIQTIDRGLSIVEKLRGVRYRRRDNDQQGVGVIAQEVQQVLPELVMTGESGKLSVAYGNLAAVLIEAVKELSNTVKTLQDKVEELEKKG